MLGKPTKVKIIAYKSSTYSTGDKKGEFVALINPESYTLDIKTVLGQEQGNGTSAKEQKFAHKAPHQLTFDFLFDNTGIIDHVPAPQGVQAKIKTLQDMLFKLDGDIHEPYHMELVWGDFHFRGRATAMNINYKLFNPDGAPIRAVVKLTVAGSVKEEDRSAEERKSSPDLTHTRIFKKGDSLPWLCNEIYGHPKYYIQVARANDISNFRKIKEGTEITFPPFAKTA